MPRAGSETWDATRKNGDSNYLSFENEWGEERQRGGEGFGRHLSKRDAQRESSLDHEASDSTR